jgi:hypothetical protein
MYIYYSLNGNIEWRGKDTDTISSKFYDEQGKLRANVERFEDVNYLSLDVEPVYTPRANTKLEDLLIAKGLVTQSEVDGLKQVSVEAL